MRGRVTQVTIPSMRSEGLFEELRAKRATGGAKRPQRFERVVFGSGKLRGCIYSVGVLILVQQE